MWTIITIAALQCMQPAAPDGSSAQDTDTIAIVAKPRELPQNLSNLNMRRATSARELIDALYDALPQVHKDKLARYFGFVVEGQLDSAQLTHCYSDMYLRELVGKALSNQRSRRLQASVRCLGPLSERMIGVIIALRYYLQSSNISSKYLDRGRGFELAAFVSERLVERCDRVQ